MSPDIDTPVCVQYERQRVNTAPGLYALSPWRGADAPSRASLCGSVYQGCRSLAYRLSRRQTYGLLARHIPVSVAVQSLSATSSLKITNLVGGRLTLSVLTVAIYSRLPVRLTIRRIFRQQKKRPHHLSVTGPFASQSV